MQERQRPSSRHGPRPQDGSTRPGEVPRGSFARRPRVCIVDDDRIARETAAALLLPDGYELVFAQSGQDLLARIDEILPDVILLDVMMPGLDGFEICRLLKENPRWRPIPLILITALDSREDLVYGLDAGADEFLAKPVHGPELRARVRSMLRIKDQYDQLQTAFRLRRDLANMIVHDMRVPLSAALLYSQLIRRRGELAAKDLADLEVIESQVRRLDGFVNDMLQVAKMDGGRLILHGTLVEASALVREVGEVHAAMAESKGVKLVLDLPQEPLAVHLDASLLGRVLDNLLSNALRVSRAGTTIELRLRKPVPSGEEDRPVRLRVEVADMGPGVPARMREEIFDMFRVGETKDPQGPHFGLGLTFARQVVEAHGGRMWVEDNQPRGSVFVVEL